MFNPIAGGIRKVVQGLTCHLPPVGYGTHSETGQMAKTDVLKRSDKKEEQYWEPPELPEELEDWRDEEERRQKTDPDWEHPELLRLKKREWHRRYYGVWFYNNGEPTYITGPNYFYLTYWKIDIGLPDFRIIDQEYFFFWQYCVEDPFCLGICEINKRRNGKTYRAACILYETISRSKDSHAGIQSKNKIDAEEVFQAKLIPMFQELPFFFRPEYDKSKGDAPKESLRFYRTAMRGRRADSKNKVKELRSTITFKDSKPKAYDGRKLKRLLLDESGKVEVDVQDRHKVVQYCLMDNRRRIIGKMIVTTTVEEIGVRFGFKGLWKQSDQYNREPNGKTASGLYKFFMPAHRSGDYDIYGNPEEEKTLKEILSDRKAYEDNAEELNDLVRKEPLTEDEAFRISSKNCHFNPGLLNDRLDDLNRMDNYSERGDFIWENGERDTKVKWAKNPKGRWEICWLFKNPEESNNVMRHGSYFRPGNGHAFIAGCDPFDHEVTEDNRRSNGASFVLRRHNPFTDDLDYNKAFVCRYKARPETANIFYEDMIRQCVYFGSPIMVENNKPGLLKYFKERGYLHFLVHLPGRKEPGIPSTAENKILLVEALQEYVISNWDKIYFPDLIYDLLDFEIENTHPYDLTMAAGWTLIGDMYKAVRRNTNELKEITDLFRLYKAG
jgi:hypothetical protein